MPTIELCIQPILLQIQEPGNWAYQWQIDGQDIPGANASALQVNQEGRYSVQRSSKSTNQDQCSMPVSSEPVEVVPEPLPSALIDKKKDILCEGGTLALQAETKSSYVYEWRIGMNQLAETGPSITVQKGGTYSLLVRNEQNGCTATDSIEVKVESIRVKLPAEVEILRGQNVELTPKVESTSSAIQYKWSPPEGLNSTTESKPLASPEKTTDYILQVETPGGCQATAPIKVVVNECQEIPIPIPTVLYKNKPVKEIELCSGGDIKLETDSEGDWNYQWQINGQNITDATGSSYVASKVGSYTVVRSSKNETPAICIKPAISIGVEVVAGIPPIANIEATSIVFCAGKPLQLSADSATSSRYTWSLDGKMLSQTSDKVNVDSPGTYTLVVLDGRNGCTSTDSILIRQEEISVSLADEVWVKRGESVMLNPQVNTSDFPVSYLWSPPLGLSNPLDSLPVALPDQSTEYVVRVSTPGGCEAKDSIMVSIIDRIFLPDAFSPNGDGINDVFIIPNGQVLIENIKIYNRWGQVIFSEAGYTTPWDGYFKNKVVENGMYNYIIKTSDNIYKGAVRVMY
ncbi:T9SS type B sorting domain-containing protein [Salmonirosea aquatica]